jgi:hypothetical protein
LPKPPTAPGLNLNVEVQNFGQVASKSAKIKIVYTSDGKEVPIVVGKIPELKPYQKTMVILTCESFLVRE